VAPVELRLDVCQGRYRLLKGVPLETIDLRHAFIIYGRCWRGIDKLELIVVWGHLEGLRRLAYDAARVDSGFNDIDFWNASANVVLRSWVIGPGTRASR
jgi:hypothetical protein